MNYELRIKNEEKVLPIVWIDGKQTVINVDAQLQEEGANLHIIGIFLGTKNNAIVFNTNVVHKAPHTKSLTTIRGVFLNRASFDNDGLIRINRGAKNADGYFASKILLFDDAKGRSVPSLEIDENELKAGHASTIGRPDEEQLFYMRSRGISEKEAEKLIITGFFTPLLIFLSEDERGQVKKKLEEAI